MHLFLGALVILLNTMDNATTFLCLRRPVEGFEVIELNPLAAWLFETVGLIQGLVFESLLTLIAVGFLVLTESVPRWARTTLLVVLCVLPAWAVANNVQVMAAIGILL